METSPEIDHNPSPLEQRRERLRRFADRVMEAIEQLPMPESFIEGERAQRCLAQTDRTLVQLHSRPGTRPNTVPNGGTSPAPSRSATPRAPEPEPPFAYSYDDDDIDDPDDLDNGDDSHAPPAMPETTDRARRLEATYSHLETLFAYGRELIVGEDSLPLRHPPP